MPSLHCEEIFEELTKGAMMDKKVFVKFLTWFRDSYPGLKLWMNDYMVVTISERFLKWLQSLPPKEQKSVLKTKVSEGEPLKEEYYKPPDERI